jgi:iron(III) transport system substrate-binding protein
MPNTTPQHHRNSIAQHKMPFRLSLVAAVLLAGSTGLASAQATAWKDIVAAAQKEGRVVVFSAQGPSVMERIKADFEKTYPGIKLEQTRMSSGPMMSKLDQERATGADGGDVTVTTEVIWLEDRLKDGTLKAPVGPSVASWPAAYMIKGTIPVLALEPFGIAYNTNLVKTPITGYKDLLKPEFNGKVGMIDLVATSLFAFYDWLEKKEGADYLTKLAAQKPKIYGSNPIGAQMVASGELPVVSFMSATMVLPLVAKGAPVKLVYPDSAFGIQYAGGIVAWSKRPNAAQVYMDYLMSRAGQTAWNGLGEAASPLPNIPGSGDVRAIVPYDPARFNNEMMKNYRVRWEGIIKK